MSDDRGRPAGGGRPEGRGGPGWPRAVAIGAGYYAATTLLVVAAVAFSRLYVWPSPGWGHIFYPGSPDFTNWDGQWYKSIAVRGYFYTPGFHSNVVFFPAYPLLGWAAARATGLSIDVALLVVSNACLLATFCLVSVELSGTPEGRSRRPWVLLALGLAPTSFFFRMAYSESLFLLLMTVSLVAIRRRWPPLAVALVIGLATAARPVGVGLVPGLAVDLWRRSPTARGFAARLALCLPVSCWGLAAYVGYQARALHEPLAFVKAQASWNKHGGASAREKAVALLTLRPAWTRFDRDSPAYWRAHERHDLPFFSLYIADPLYFAVAVAALAVGAARGWLDGPEAAAGLAVAVVVAMTKAFETDMEAFGRYSFANLPVLLALGEALRRLPEAVSVGLLTAGALMMAAYTALFVQWYPMI